MLSSLLVVQLAAGDSFARAHVAGALGGSANFASQLLYYPNDALSASGPATTCGNGGGHG